MTLYHDEVIGAYNGDEGNRLIRRAATIDIVTRHTYQAATTAGEDTDFRIEAGAGTETYRYGLARSDQGVPDIGRIGSQRTVGIARRKDIVRGTYGGLASERSATGNHAGIGAVVGLGYGQAWQ